MKVEFGEKKRESSVFFNKFFLKQVRKVQQTELSFFISLLKMKVKEGDKLLKL